VVLAVAVEVRVNGKPSVKAVREALAVLQRRLGRYDEQVRIAVADVLDKDVRDERVSA